jgi:universal stress protein A
MFTRILVPTDFSESSDAALDHARAIADKFHSTLHVLHVIDPNFETAALSSEAYFGHPMGNYELLVADAQSKLSHRVYPADRARYGATTEVMTGMSADTIVDFADDQQIDLIVMGTHGRTGLAHLLMGSVAEQVVRKAPCPVLTVRKTPASQTAAVSPAVRTSQSGTAAGRG